MEPPKRFIVAKLQEDYSFQKGEVFYFEEEEGSQWINYQSSIRHWSFVRSSFFDKVKEGIYIVF